ncbi:MAG: clostripain-related cysteine peptidase, partial [Candidatus Parabeggiatoa sp.]|nr:clostripain-related cysteine peptidase [Candidatus Parabeggiatoa sp.]
MKRFFFGFIFALSHPAFALYDFAAINIIPNTDQISFCLEYDTRKVEMADKWYIADNLYIATVTKPAGEVQFVEPTTDTFKMTPWPSSGNAPVFSKWHSNSEPICLGPFAKAALQDISIYAGLGDSLQDVMQRNSLIKFFDGFPKLPPEKVWTVMVYLVGSDLEAKPDHKEGHHWASKDILEMLAGTTLPNTTSNLVITTGGSTRNGWNTVKRAFIQNGQQYVLEDLGPQNMSNPQILSEFVIWAKTAFPAQHYALILWNHGGGTQGFGQDSSSAGNKKIMSFTELHQAYQSIREQIDNPLDIVVYDACLMASIEVAQITATVANAMAGSAELEPGHGIDYAHILSHVSQTPPANGIDFGKVVKTGYIQHTKDEKTFDKSQITYSVFDLTQMVLFSETFKDFAVEFKKVLKKLAFQNYETLSRGIIRAPGYPFKQTGKLRALDSNNIRIDLYSILQTVGPSFPKFQTYAKELLTIIDKMVVDYEGNIADIDPKAGRVSLDIGKEKSYLSSLPEAYTLLSEGLDFYNSQKRNDSFIPDSEFVCPRGLTCAFAQWLELDAEHILGVEAYFGEKKAESSTVYLIDPAFYQYRELS